MIQNRREAGWTHTVTNCFQTVPGVFSLQAAVSKHRGKSPLRLTHESEAMLSEIKMKTSQLLPSVPCAPHCRRPGSRTQRKAEPSLPSRVCWVLKGTKHLHGCFPVPKYTATAEVQQHVTEHGTAGVLWGNQLSLTLGKRTPFPEGTWRRTDVHPPPARWGPKELRATIQSVLDTRGCSQPYYEGKKKKISPGIISNPLRDNIQGRGDTVHRSDTQITFDLEKKWP